MASPADARAFSGKNGPGGNEPPREMTFGEHLEALRKAVFRAILLPIVLIIAIWPFWDYAHWYISHMLLNAKQLEMLTRTTLMDSFSLSVKIAGYSGIVIAVPWVVANLWWFVSPGLTANERKFGFIAIPSCILLFSAGVAFGFFVVVPAMLKFLIGFGAEEFGDQLLMIGDFYDLVFAMLFACGLIFQIPLIVATGVRFRIIDPKFVTRHRRAVVFISALLGACLTPTADPVSMALVAVPIYLLVEGGLIVGRIWRRGADARAAKESKDIVESFQQGMADAAGSDAGLLGTKSADDFATSLQSLARSFGENVRAGSTEFQKLADEEQAARQSETQRPAVSRGLLTGAPDMPLGPLPEVEDSRERARASAVPVPAVSPGQTVSTAPVASDALTTQTAASAPAVPFAVEAVSPASAPENTPASTPPGTSSAAMPTGEPGFDPDMAPRAPGAGSSVNMTTGIAQSGPPIPLTSGPDKPVPKLPQELRRRIDAYLRERMGEILDELIDERRKNEGDKGN